MFNILGEYVLGFCIMLKNAKKKYEKNEKIAL